MMLFFVKNLNFFKLMIPLIKPTMIHYVLTGERNLGVEKAKVVAKYTKTDPMVWLDKSRVGERRKAWEKAFPKVKKNEKKG